jgi:hypothetical protein
VRRSLFFALGLGVALVGRARDARAGAPCGGAVVDAGDGGGDAGLCPANEYCGLPDGGRVTDGGAGTCAVEACGGGSGPCATNVYCAQPDGGAILDGAAGTCRLEPCVASSDCADPNRPICDTSQNPFACVECISGSDCAGVLVCDTATHTCVNPPDASVPDATAPDGGADASPEDAEAPTDGAADGAGSASDASGKGDASGPVAVVGPPDEGSLSGGAWDCGLAPGRGVTFGAIAGPIVVAGLFVSRRRSRKKRPSRDRV